MVELKRQGERCPKFEDDQPGSRNPATRAELLQLSHSG